MKQCPTCNRTYPDNQQFCIEDGTPLANVAETPSDYSASAPYTPQGSAPPPNEPYNPNPTPAGAQWTPPQPAQAAPRKSKLPWIIAGVVLLLVLGIGAVAIVGALVYYNSSHSSVANMNNSNYNSSRNANRNSSSGLNSNSNSNFNSGSSNTGTSDSSSMDDDGKHKLFQAAGITKDNALILKVLHKLGLMKGDNTMTDDYSQFIKDHFSWALKNTAWIKEYNDPVKAREYVNEHIND